jgi:ATP-dependent protease ClpP protease subunit
MARWIRASRTLTEVSFAGVLGSDSGATKRTKLIRLSWPESARSSSTLPKSRRADIRSSVRDMDETSDPSQIRRMPHTNDKDKDDDPKPEPFHERELAKTRTVLVFGEVNSELARTASAQLLALAARSDDPIRVIVHSQGGHVESADTIFDVIRFIRPEVIMIGSGWVASAGALIYAAAEKKNRIALPNTRFLLHQPLGGVQGRADARARRRDRDRSGADTRHSCSAPQDLRRRHRSVRREARRGHGAESLDER